MPWIFGSFLVSPCGLTSCHVVISKQEYDWTIRALGYHRSVTGRKPSDENYTVTFRENAENRSLARDM